VSTWPARGPLRFGGQMSRGTAVASTWVLAAALLVSVLIQVWALPSMVDQAVTWFSEVKSIAIPSMVWGTVAILCWQVAAAGGIHVLALARTGKFDASAYGWLRGVLGCLIVFVALVVSAWIALGVLEWATPGVILGLFVSGVMALVAIISLVLFLQTRPAAAAAAAAVRSS
jgi:hypothetical protein